MDDAAELLRWADALDVTERPAADEFDVSAAIRKMVNETASLRARLSAAEAERERLRTYVADLHCPMLMGAKVGNCPMHDVQRCKACAALSSPSPSPATDREAGLEDGVIDHVPGQIPPDVRDAVLEEAAEALETGLDVHRWIALWKSNENYNEVTAIAFYHQALQDGWEAIRAMKRRR